MLRRFLGYPFGNAMARAIASGFESMDHLVDRFTAESTPSVRQALFPDGKGSEPSITYQLCLELQRIGDRIATALPEAPGRVVRTYLQRSEIENLKLFCRTILGTGDGPPPASLLLPLPRNSRLPQAALADAESIDQFTAILPKGVLRDRLRHAAKVPPGDRLFAVETSLDRYFWENILGAAERLRPFDKSAAMEVLGGRADLDRFGIISRGLRAGLDTKVILSGLPDMGTAFPYRQVRLALCSGDPAGRIKELYPEPGVDDPLGRAGEIGLYRRLRRILQQVMRSHPFDISIPLAVLLLKELEIRETQIVMSGFLLGKERDELTALAVETGR